MEGNCATLITVNTTIAEPEAIQATTTTFYLIGSIMSVIFVLALGENISVLMVYKKSPKLHTATNFWITAVIVCDLLIVINAFPFVIIASFSEDYIFGEIGCKWDGFIVTLLGTSSIFLFTGLSIHRYKIMHGKSRSIDTKSRRYSIYGILFCFLFGLMWGIFPLVGWGSFALEGIGISCAPDWRSQTVPNTIYTASMFTCVLFIPLLVIGVCYTKVLFKVWKEKRNHSAWIMKNKVKRDIKVTVTVALTIVSFLVSWTPYAVVTLCESFLDIDVYSISPLLVQLPCLMAKTSCVWNPLVYVLHNQQFRKAFIKYYSKYLTSCKSCNTGDDDSDNNVISTESQESFKQNNIIATYFESNKQIVIKALIRPRKTTISTSSIV